MDIQSADLVDLILAFLLAGLILEFYRLRDEIRAWRSEQKERKSRGSGDVT